MDYEYGGFWRRAFAFLIDNAILTFIFVWFFILGALALGLSAAFNYNDLSYGRLTGLTIGYLVIYHLSMALIGMLYFTYFHGIAGQTPGKMVLRLKVLRIDGRDLNLGIGFLRWVGYIVSGLLFHLGFIWIAFNEKKRGWHDMIAGTIVVRTKTQMTVSETVLESVPAD